MLIVRLKYIPVIFSALLVFTTRAGGETILEEFNSMDELGNFWDISTWTGSNRTHSRDNVSIENGVLVLKLSGSQPGELPVCSEITSKRSDFRYGSYTASIKTTDIAGAVVGWFIYLGNPLNEIDVEFLTEDISKVYYTLHHIETNVDHQVVPLGFDPSADFHEYRFDWFEGRVDYYIDGVYSATLDNQTPDTQAKIMLNHWSGNIQGWGGPAPEEDVYMWVDYMQYSSEYPDSGATVAARRGNRLIGPVIRYMPGRGELMFSGNVSGQTRVHDARGRLRASGRASVNMGALADGLYFISPDGNRFGVIRN